MFNKKTIRRITWFDRLNASALMLFTPERAAVRLLQAATPERQPRRTAPPKIPVEYDTIAGTKVRFAQGGRKSGPTILLLNPLPQSILAFDSIWEPLGRDFQLFAYDLPGFGGSEGGEEWMSFSQQAAFLTAFIKAKDIERPHIVGPDIGMPTALSYAASGDCQAASLLVGDGPCLVASSNGSLINKISYSSFWRTVMQIAGPGAGIEVANRLCYLNYQPSAEEISDYIAGLASRMNNMFRWFIDYPKSLAGLEPQLTRISLPTKIFWGDADKLLFVDNGTRLAALLPQASLTIFPNCGHFSYQDQAERFVTMVRDWVKAHESSEQH
jgi:pimeloyl-ACP methyl ester carboxylesterase